MIPRASPRGFIKSCPKPAKRKPNSSAKCIRCCLRLIAVATLLTSPIASFSSEFAVKRASFSAAIDSYDI